MNDDFLSAEALSWLREAGFRRAKYPPLRQWRATKWLREEKHLEIRISPSETSYLIELASPPEYFPECGIFYGYLDMPFTQVLDAGIIEACQHILFLEYKRKHFIERQQRMSKNVSLQASQALREAGYPEQDGEITYWSAEMWLATVDIDIHVFRQYTDEGYHVDVRCDQRQYSLAGSDALRRLYPTYEAAYEAGILAACEYLESLKQQL